MINFWKEKIIKYKYLANKYKNADVILISDFYRLRNVGSEKPIHWYKKYSKTINSHVELIYGLDNKSLMKLVLITIFSNKRKIIINGIRPLQHFQLLLFALVKRPNFYFHETEYVLNRVKNRIPFKFWLIKQYMKISTALCTSKAQSLLFESKYNVKNIHIIYNNNQIIQGREIQDTLFSKDKIHIVMAGTIQGRKGGAFFSKLADFAKEKNSRLQFHWIGKPGLNETLYQSENVIWHGFRDDYLNLLLLSDIFFLASIDDPLPLTAFDALANNCKCVVFRETGTSELIEGIKGCSIYEKYDIEEAFDAIEKVVHENLDSIKVNNILNEYVSVESFANRLHKALGVTSYKTNGIKTKIFEKIDIDEIGFLHDIDRSRPVVIAGNGPSLAKINKNLIPKQAVKFRANMFFLENEKYLGSNVDLYFWSVYKEELQDTLLKKIEEKEYSIKAFMYPMDLTKFNGKAARTPINEKHAIAFSPSYDHWAVLATKPEIARLMMTRPLPTTGLMMLAVAMIMGFKEVYMVGVDFYQSTDTRYAFEIPKDIKETIGEVHYTPGYEKGAHSFEYDLFFFNFIKKLYPDVIIYSLSEHSFITTLIPMAGNAK